MHKASFYNFTKKRNNINWWLYTKFKIANHWTTKFNKPTSYLGQVQFFSSFLILFSFFFVPNKFFLKIFFLLKFFLCTKKSPKKNFSLVSTPTLFVANVNEWMYTVWLVCGWMYVLCLQFNEKFGLCTQRVKIQSDMCQVKIFARRKIHAFGDIWK